MTTDALDRWKEVFARDLDGLEDLLDDNVVFQSPAVHTPQEGRAITAKYLRAAGKVLHEDFRYVGEWRGDRSAILEFECRVGDLYANGVDMIWWNEAGRIVRFKVMVRPLKALNAVIPRMGAALAGA